jgi:hypothetical protein
MTLQTIRQLLLSPWTLLTCFGTAWFTESLLFAYADYGVIGIGVAQIAGGFGSLIISSLIGYVVSLLLFFNLLENAKRRQLGIICGAWGVVVVWNLCKIILIVSGIQ